MKEETKIEYKDCESSEPINIDGETFRLGCGGKNCVETYYMRNPVTLKWQVMGGHCTKCGMKFLV